MVGLNNGAVFICGNGGHLRMIDDIELPEFGMNDGWAYWKDLRINAHNDMTLDISDNYDIEGMVQHITGDPVMRFSLTASRPNGKADLEIRGLKPEASYRLLFDGVLAKTSTGRAHAKTDRDGKLRFNEVVIPNG